MRRATALMAGLLLFPTLSGCAVLGATSNSDQTSATPVATTQDAVPTTTATTPVTQPAATTTRTAPSSTLPPAPAAAPAGYKWATLSEDGLRVPVPQDWTSVDPSVFRKSVDDPELKKLADQFGLSPQQFVDQMSSAKALYMGKTSGGYTPLVMVMLLPLTELPSESLMKTSLEGPGATNVATARTTTPAGNGMNITFVMKVGNLTVNGGTLLVDVGRQVASIQTGSLDMSAAQRLEVFATHTHLVPVGTTG